jgi:hypothetical protein
MRSKRAVSLRFGVRGRVHRAPGDGRPVYGMGGLDGLGGRVGGQETTSGDWADQAEGSLHVAKVRVAGSNPVVRSL